MATESGDQAVTLEEATRIGGEPNEQTQRQDVRACADGDPAPRPVSANGAVGQSEAIAPTFQAGGVSCREITCTSVRVAWAKPEGMKHPVYAYRVCTAEVGKGFEVTYSEAPSCSTEAVVVGLSPGRLYQFHVASISAEKMLVPGSSVVSPPVRLPQAQYEEAWFFEGGERDLKWQAYDALGPDCFGRSSIEASRGAAALDDIRCSIISRRCYTGLKSLCLNKPAELAGGVFVDTDVKEGWLYIAKARVFHESESPVAEDGKQGTTRLVLCDLRDVKAASSPATKTMEWELRIAVHCGVRYGGEIFVDAVELHRGGPTPAESAVSAVMDVMDERKRMPSKVLVRVAYAHILNVSDKVGPRNPFVKVFVGDVEAYRTKVIPMTSCPVWDETRVLCMTSTTSEEGVGNRASAGGIRFEIRDHDFRDDGRRLGEVKLTAAQVMSAPPHTLEHNLEDLSAVQAAPGGDSSKARRIRKTKRGHGDRSCENQAAHPERPSVLALALQVSWPEDPTTLEGRLVATFQDDQKPLGVRLQALKELSAVALREPRNIADAAKAKEALIRARAPQAAVWELADPAYSSDACHLLMGLLNVEHGVKRSEAGYNLGRRLQQYVLAISPTNVAVALLRAGRPESKLLLALLARLYVGQPAVLHEDVVNVPGFFYSLVVHIDDSAPAQALMCEISSGKRAFSPAVLSMFRRYRVRIPAVPGLWRASVLRELSAEEALPPEQDQDELEARDLDPHLPHASARAQCYADKGVVYAIALGLFAKAFPFFTLVVGARRLGTCEQPVAILMFMHGWLLLVASLGRDAFKHCRSLLVAYTGAWLYPMILCVIFAHLGFVVGLLAATVGVGYTGEKDGNREGSWCSSETFAWGIFTVVTHLILLIAPPVMMCQRWWDEITQADPALILPEQEVGGNTQSL